MSVGSPSTEMLEDKKCRICGLADKDNLNIFTANLQNKICTVYPFIVLYRNDPLPKNICKKCMTSVNATFNDIQKVSKLQNKWIHNVSTNQPKNDYIQALNLLKNCSGAVQNIINSTFGKVVSDEAINRLLANALNEVANQESSTHPIEQNTDRIKKEYITEKPLNGELRTSRRKRRNKTPLYVDFNDEEEEEEDNLVLSKIATSKTNRSSLTSPSLPVKCRNCPLVFESLKELSIHQINHLNIRIPKIFQMKCLNKDLRRGRLISTKNRQSIRCLNCWRVFEDNKCVLEHWSNAECDYFCTICGKEFLHAPKTLREHISTVHGVNYKSLRAKRDKFITKWPTLYKSNEDTDMDDFQGFEDNEDLSVADLRQGMISAEATTTMDEETHILVGTSESQKSGKFVKCRVCSRLFQNFKACNSHMRAHKGPYTYNDTTPLPEQYANTTLDTMKTKIIKPPTPPPDVPPDLPPPPIATSPHTDSLPIIPATNSTEISVKTEFDTTANTNTDASNSSTSTNPANPSPTNIASKVPTSTAPRGIRMKFVTRRSDLNGMLPSIKVKSLSDLQGHQRNMTTHNPTPAQPPPTLHTDRVQNNATTQRMQHSMPLEISYDALNLKHNPNYFRFT